MAIGSRIVIKIGGELLASDEIDILARDLVSLARPGSNIFVVHGGGPQATAMQARLGIEAHIVGGRRITDAETLDVMKMVLAGKLNVDICSRIRAAGGNPIGLHGASGLVIEAQKRPPRIVSGGGPDPIDFGHVGDVVGFNEELLNQLSRSGYIPVLACLGADARGNIFNINADIVGNKLAAAIAADHLFLITGTPGVLRDAKDPTTRIPVLSESAARAAIASGTVSGGMIPKIEEALAVLKSGVGAIHILGKLTQGDLLRAMDDNSAIGTTLVS